MIEERIDKYLNEIDVAYPQLKKAVATLAKTLDDMDTNVSVILGSKKYKYDDATKSGLRKVLLSIRKAKTQVRSMLI